MTKRGFLVPLLSLLAISTLVIQGCDSYGAGQPPEPAPQVEAAAPTPTPVATATPPPDRGG